MKAADLADILLEHPEFDVEFSLLEPDGSEWGIKLRTFPVEITDIGHSEKKIKLGTAAKID